MLGSMVTKERQADAWEWFGRMLRAHREGRGLTGNRLSHLTLERVPEIGISQANLSQIELGKRRPSNQNIEALASVPELGVTIDQLECWRDVSPIKPEGVRRIKKWLPELLADEGAIQAPEAEPTVGADLRDKAIPLSRSAWAVPKGVKPTEEEKELMRQLEPADLLELGPAYVEEFWLQAPAKRVRTFKQWIADNETAGRSPKKRKKA